MASLGLLGAIGGAGKGLSESAATMWKLKALDERDKRLAELEDRRAMMKIDADDRRVERKAELKKQEFIKTGTGDTIGSFDEEGIFTEAYVNPNKAENKLDAETKAQVELHKNLTTTLSKGGEYSMETEVTKQLKHERDALTNTLISKGVLPETVTREAPLTTAPGRTIQRGEFEPAEADWVSDTLGAKYGSGEIQDMIKQAKAHVTTGDYKNRTELRKALGDTVPVQVVAQILDAVFPEGNGLLNAEQPLKVSPTQPKPTGVVDPFK